MITRLLREGIGFVNASQLVRTVRPTEVLGPCLIDKPARVLAWDQALIIE